MNARPLKRFPWSLAAAARPGRWLVVLAGIAAAAFGAAGPDACDPPATTRGGGRDS